jgi:hypothetical protein
MTIQGNFINYMSGEVLVKHQTFEALKKLCLMATPLLFHWQQYTQYNNMFYHEDMYYKAWSLDTNSCLIFFADLHIYCCYLCNAYGKFHDQCIQS